ncbi:tail tube protein [Arthrobacter phage Altadena]|uniref:Tail tube protein n=1 Tax=Arthrobacter phage Altadena TaxID=3059064 RepID=A0AA96HVB5_9CAUD|nr:tail tube protein [Arthrobacter phage Altadena]
MKSTKQNFITTASGIPGNWRTWSGGGGSADTSLDYDGGDPIPDILSAPPTFDDIEIVRTYDPIADAAWVRDLRRKIGRSRHTLTKFAVDMNWIAVGDPDTYPGCVLKGIQEPETDASSGDASEITLTFATTGPA